MGKFREMHVLLWSITALKMRFCIKDFFSKSDRIRSFLRIWSHLLKKSLMENFIFRAVNWVLRRCDLNCFDYWREKNLSQKIKFPSVTMIFIEYMVELTTSNNRLQYETNLLMKFVEQVLLFLKKAIKLYNNTSILLFVIIANFYFYKKATNFEIPS